MFCLQISKEEREQAFNEYRAYLKEKAERRKAAEDGEEGNADKHKVRVAALLIYFAICKRIITIQRSLWSVRRTWWTLAFSDTVLLFKVLTVHWLVCVLRRSAIRRRRTSATVTGEMKMTNGTSGQRGEACLLLRPQNTYRLTCMLVLSVSSSANIFLD